MSDIYGFLVGIERYDQAGWNVRGPCANAIGIAEWLLSIGIPGGNVFLFLAPENGHGYGPKIEALEGSGVDIRQQADFGTIDTFCRAELAGQRPADSRLLFFWSGHGFMEDDGTHVFICSNYTADKLTNRVFNGSNFRRHLRWTSDFTCFREQIFLADVCAVHTNLVSEPNRSSPQDLVSPARQITYFATPEGEYAKGDDGIGVFTRITTDVLQGFPTWPGLEEFCQAMNAAFQASSQKPFLVYEADGEHVRPYRQVGVIAPDSSPIHSRVAEAKRTALEIRLNSLLDDYRAANEQAASELSAVNRGRIERQIESIERDIGLLQHQLDAIQG